MSDNSVPLSVYGSRSTASRSGHLAIGTTLLQQQSSQWGYWIVVIDRSTLTVVYDEVHASANAAPDLGVFNSTDYFLVVAALGVGLDKQPQGDFFKFLDLNGAGRELRRIEQIAVQFNCGSLGMFGYTLVGVLGDLNQPGFELSAIGTADGIASVEPILTVQLMPTTINGKTIYTPVQIDNA